MTRYGNARSSSGATATPASRKRSSSAATHVLRPSPRHYRARPRCRRCAPRGVSEITPSGADVVHPRSSRSVTSRPSDSSANSRTLHDVPPSEPSLRSPQAPRLTTVAGLAFTSRTIHEPARTVRSHACCRSVCSKPSSRQRRSRFHGERFGHRQHSCTLERSGMGPPLVFGAANRGTRGTKAWQSIRSHRSRETSAD